MKKDQIKAIQLATERLKRAETNLRMAQTLPVNTLVKLYVDLSTRSNQTCIAIIRGFNTTGPLLDVLACDDGYPLTYRLRRPRKDGHIHIAFDIITAWEPFSKEELPLCLGYANTTDHLAKALK